MSDHVLDRLSAFLDAELPAREQAEVVGHLRDCSACAAHLDLLRSVDAEAAALPVAVPDGYFDTLPGRIRGRLEGTPRPVVRRVPAWTWAVAAALVLGVVTPLTMQRNRMETPGTAVVAPPSVTYPPTAAAEPAPEAGGVARPTPGKAADSAVAGSKGKDDLAESKLGLELANRDRADLRAAAPPPPADVLREEQAKNEAEKEQRARGAEAESGAAAASRMRRSAPGGPYAQQQAPLQSPAAPAFAEAPVEAPEIAAAADELRADAGEPARDESLVAKRGSEPPRSQAPGGAAGGRVSSAVASSDEKVFRVLHDATAPPTLASLRERREAWRSFTRDFPSSPRADEARVRVIETGAESWRVGGDPADLSRAREDARAYLAREDATQAPRVRAVLEALPASP
jgi:Putative zinc-finger